MIDICKAVIDERGYITEAVTTFKVYNPATRKMDLWAVDKNNKTSIIKRNVDKAGIN